MASILTQYTLEFRGLPVLIRRKRIRHGHVRVHADGSVSLSVPLFLPPARLEEILQSRWDWIQQQLQKRPAQLPQELVQGATVPFLGRMLSLCLMERPGRPTLAAHAQTLFLHIRPGLDQAARRKALNCWYKARLEEVLGPLIARWQPILGVSVQNWRIRDMKSRWGSCRPQVAELCFSLELCKKPLECIEFVVVHELAHILEGGHGPRFKAIMDRALPAWKELDKALNGR